MSPPVRILLLWAAFTATHIGLSSLPVRPWIVARIGERPFLGLYWFVALALFVPLFGTFLAHKHGGTWLWIMQRGMALRWAMYLGHGFAIVLLISFFIRPSPGSLVPGDPTPRGIYRITRHPFSMGLAIIALLHLLPNTGNSTDAAFCVGLVAFAVVACWHQDRRKLAARVRGFREFYEATPFFLFMGRDSFRSIRELPPIVVGVAVGATIIARYFQLLD